MISATVFSIAFAACLALALVRGPIYGLYAYLGVFYVHPPSRWWGALLPDLRWSFLAGAVTLVALALHRPVVDPERKSWYRTVPGAALLLFVGWFWLQSLWALDPLEHEYAAIQYTKYLVMFALVFRLADTRARVVDLLTLHVAGCFLLGVFALFDSDYVDGRLDGVGGPGIDDANSFSMFLGTGVAAGAMLCLIATGARRLACIGAMPFILNGIVLAGSRGAMLGLVSAGLLLLALKPPRHKALFWTFAALAVVLVVSIVDLRFIERMMSLKQMSETPEEIDSSAENRLVLIEAQFRMFAGYPMGTGHKGTAVLSPIYLDSRWLTKEVGAGDEVAGARSSHNTFMTVLVEQGVPGVPIFFAVVLWGAVSASRLLRVQRRRSGSLPEHEGVAAAAVACCAALLVVLVAGNFTDYLMAEVQIWLLAMLASMMDLLRRCPLPTMHAARLGRAIAPTMREARSITP